jgi:hypothetical protein
MTPVAARRRRVAGSNTAVGAQAPRSPAS